MAPDASAYLSKGYNKKSSTSFAQKILGKIFVAPILIIPGKQQQDHNKQR